MPPPDMNYTLEIYDVTDTFVSPPSGPRLMYGVGELPQGDPQQVSKVIPPSTDAMLQPHRHKAVHQINLTDPSRSFQAWCQARSKTAVLEGLKESTQRKEHNKRAFIASTAHELRTPIIGMKGMLTRGVLLLELNGMLEQLVEGHMEREMREDVCMAAEEAEMVLLLVNTVLDISKVEAGCMQLERLPFHPRAWLLAALQQHEARAAEAGLPYEDERISHPSSLHAPGHCQGPTFVLSSLCVPLLPNNAIKFTASGGVCVRLQCLPPDTHIPTHLLSPSCLLADATPCCSPAAAPTAASTSPAAAAAAGGGGAAAANASSGATATAVVAPCDGANGGIRKVQRRRGGAGKETQRERAGADALAAAEAGCKAGTAAVVGRGEGGAEGSRKGSGEGAWVGAVRQWWGRAAMPWCWMGAEPEGHCGGRCVVLVACEDTGCGIAEEEQRDVFQAFMQVSPAPHAAWGRSAREAVAPCCMLLCPSLAPAAATAAAAHAARLSARASSAATAAPFTSNCLRQLVDSRKQVAAGGSSKGARRAESGGDVRAAGVETSGLTRHTCAIAARGGGEVQGGGVGDKCVNGVGKSVKEALKELLQGLSILVVDDNAIDRSQPLCTLPCTLYIHQVVDDNLINQRVAASTLARYRAEVALAESGEAALRLLQARHSFRLVLMNLHMPRLDGFQTTARLRAFEAAAQMAREELVKEGVHCIPELREGVEGGEGGWWWQKHIDVVAVSADVDSTVAARATQVGPCRSYSMRDCCCR
ncbi:unnamed protein product [Closterium sp. Yama58-4]|nr:unnamed protein product [Closterium sp. Yama58-4]